MKARQFLTVIGIVILVIAVTWLSNAYLAKPPQANTPQAQETAYERVMRTGTIRCGYTPYSVGLFKDPNTGALQGIYKDLIEEVATQLGLKIVWAEEVSWGTQIEGLKTGRYDMMCSPDSMTAPRTRAADYSIPLYFSPVAA